MPARRRELPATGDETGAQGWAGPDCCDLNEIVAYNFRCARLALGWTQAETAVRLEPVIGRLPVVDAELAQPVIDRDALVGAPEDDIVQVAHPYRGAGETAVVARRRQQEPRDGQTEDLGEHRELMRVELPAAPSPVGGLDA